MVKLFCAIVGVAESVDIDDGASVSALKKAIKTVKPHTITTDEPDLLRLYLAKTTDNAWLLSGSEDVIKLKEGEKNAHIVLVVLPDQQRDASVKKQLRYKGRRTEVSCRKLLDAVALKLALLFDFEWYYDSPNHRGCLSRYRQKLMEPSLEAWRSDGNKGFACFL